MSAPFPGDGQVLVQQLDMPQPQQGKVCVGELHLTPWHPGTPTPKGAGCLEGVWILLGSLPLSPPKPAPSNEHSGLLGCRGARVPGDGVELPPQQKVVKTFKLNGGGWVNLIVHTSSCACGHNRVWWHQN